MHEKVVAILETVVPGCTTKGSSNLVDDGVVDSFAIASIVALIEKEFEIEVDADYIIPENFETVDTVVAFVKEIMAA